jgi:hypothetical protein
MCLVETRSEQGYTFGFHIRYFSILIIIQAAKQDEWEERNRLANQFRALEADEVQFLDSVRERELEEEFERKKAESVELNQFKA